MNAAFERIKIDCGIEMNYEIVDHRLEDIGIDSMAKINLIMTLEVDLGIMIDIELLSSESLLTVRGIVNAFEMSK